MTNRPWWLMVIAVAGLALAASANSIANGYAYDDVALLFVDPRVHSWTGWSREFARTYWPDGDGYRPLTILGWRAQWALGGGAPMAFHIVNVALHVATSIAVLWMAAAVLPLGAAWTAAAMYAVHPVHVEAIANVVGQSELVVALLVVLAAGLYVHGRSRGDVSRRRWVGVAMLYGVACLFKEHAIVLPALLLLAEATVVRSAIPLRARLATIRLPMLMLVLVALSYLLLRGRVVDGFAGFRPFLVFQALDLSATDRVLTMIGAAPQWLRLLLWPARLSAVYGPHDIDVAQGLSPSQLPGLLVLLGTVGLMLACWRKSPVTSFGIGWLIIALLPMSNLVIPAGFIIAERTLLLPSVGATIAVASALWWLWQKLEARSALRVAAAIAFMLAIGLGVWRSYTRNRVWRDDDHLWRQGVLDTPESYLAHSRLGLHLMSRGEHRLGEVHYRRAIELFPHDPLVVYSFAEQLRAAGRCDAAIPLYRWLFEATPNARRGHLGYATCLLGQAQFDEAREEALVWLRRGGRLSMGRQVLVAAKTGRDSVSARKRGAR